MSNRIRSWVRKRPIVAFYLLAFFITWSGWVPQAAYSHGRFPFNSPAFYVLGGVGPLAAALIVARFLYGKKDGEEVFKPLLRWRTGIVWYLTALLGGIVVMLATMALRKELPQGLERLIPSVPLLCSFLWYLLAAIPEALAWRGFALPRLQVRYNALASSLIVGFLWAIWHLPLLCIKDSVMASYSLWPYIIGIIATSVIHTWLFNNTGGSALIVILFHAMTNTVGPNAGIQHTLVIVVIAIVIVLIFGQENLSRHRQRITPAGTLSSPTSDLPR